MSGGRSVALIRILVGWVFVIEGVLKFIAARCRRYSGGGERGRNRTFNLLIKSCRGCAHRFESTRLKTKTLHNFGPHGWLLYAR
jgi:hypothetical protein